MIQHISPIRQEANQCKGALTIDGNVVTKNVSDHIIAHASRWVPQGSVRIFSSELESIHNVAFLTPNGKIVMIALNDSNATTVFNIQYKGKKALASIPAHAVVTYMW